jgi:hypothetical protein
MFTWDYEWVPESSRESKQYIIEGRKMTVKKSSGARVVIIDQGIGSQMSRRLGESPIFIDVATADINAVAIASVIAL